MRSRFIAGLVDGTNTSARCPRRPATWATAAPWLPPEAAMRPAAGTSARNTRWNAPRGLNEPVCCSSSSFSVTGTGKPSSPAANVENRRRPDEPGDPARRGLDVGGGDEPCHGANLAESHRRHSPTSTCTPSSRCSTGRPGSTSWWPRRWPTASRRSGSPTTATCTARWSSTRSAGARGSTRSSAPRPTWPTSTAASARPGAGASTTPAATPRAGRSSTTTSPCWPRPTPATAT